MSYKSCKEMPESSPAHGNAKSPMLGCWLICLDRALTCKCVKWQIKCWTFCTCWMSHAEERHYWGLSNICSLHLVQFCLWFCILLCFEWSRVNSEMWFLLPRVDFVSVCVIARNVWTRLRRRCSFAAEIIWAWQPRTHERLKMCIVYFKLTYWLKFYTCL